MSHKSRKMKSNQLTEIQTRGVQVLWILIDLFSDVQMFLFSYFDFALLKFMLYSKLHGSPIDDSLLNSESFSILNSRF